MFEIRKQIFCFSNYVSAWSESQYLRYNQRKSAFILSQIFDISYPSHNLTYFINNVSHKEMLLIIEIVNFATESLGIQNRLLRYYATFKVRKSESLFYKMFYMLAKNYYFHWIAGRANILSKYIIYIFSSFGGGFCGSFPMLFPKAPASCCKKILN